HDHRICLFERLGIVEQRRTPWSEIPGKYDDLLVTIFRYSQLHTRRPNHVARVNQACLNTSRDFKTLVVFDWCGQWPQLANVCLFEQRLEWRQLLARAFLVLAF